MKLSEDHRSDRKSIFKKTIKMKILLSKSEETTKPQTDMLTN